MTTAKPTDLALETREALERFTEDVRHIGEVAGLSADSQERLEMLIFKAFSGCGDWDADCWAALVLAIDALLRDRAHFPSAADSPERLRLQAFVTENADALLPNSASLSSE
jgi:hypothetical protein